MTASERIAVVTGGAGGLGRAIAQRLSRAGVTGALWDLDGGKAEAAAREIPGWRGYGVDVTSAEAVEAATGAVEADFGRIDILVNSAGITGPNLALIDYPLEAWRKTMAVNLDGVFLCCRAVVPVMRKTPFGRVVNISSIAGKEGNPNASCYSAAKAAVIAITKSLGKELAETDIRVNCVTPAAIETDLLQQMTPEFTAFVRAKIPMGRFGQPEEVANLVAWLSSEECSFSTGAVFDISGGRASY